MHVFYHCMLQSWCAYKHFPCLLWLQAEIQVCLYQHFPCLIPLSAEIQVCLPTFPMSHTIICWNPGVPTNISHVSYHYLLKSRCAYQHFPCLLLFVFVFFLKLIHSTMSNQLEKLSKSYCLLKSLCAYANISHEFYHCLLKSRCVYQYFHLLYQVVLTIVFDIWALLQTLCVTISFNNNPRLWYFRWAPFEII